MRRLRMRKRLSSEKGKEYSYILILGCDILHFRNQNFIYCNLKSALSSQSFKKIWHTCRWECISSESSRLLLSQIQPKLVLSGFQWFQKTPACYILWPRLSGHTHHGCNTSHGRGGFPPFYQPTFNQPVLSGVTEINISSFSWRNKVNPAFLLATFDSQGNYEVNKCYMPDEDNVINAYIGSFILFCVSLLIF